MGTGQIGKGSVGRLEELRCVYGGSEFLSSTPERSDSCGGGDDRGDHAGNIADSRTMAARDGGSECRSALLVCRGHERGARSESSARLFRIFGRGSGGPAVRVRWSTRKLSKAASRKENRS